MIPLEPSDADLPALLVSRGWVQGAVFSAPAAKFWFTAVEQADDEPVLTSRWLLPESDERFSDERFIVVSQTCDIKDRIDREPTIEALACTIEPDANWRQNIRKSARWYEVDRYTGLVAHAMYRVHIEKRALLSLTPYPWPDSQLRLQLFTRWLGHRFNRPAIPDPLVKAFQQPAEEAINTIRRRNQEEFKAFNDAVREIRINLPDVEEPPFDITMVMLLDQEILGEQEDDAIETVYNAIREKLNPDLVHLEPIRLVSPEQMSLAEYLATRPLYLESLTYKGDEVQGAAPLENV